uniref:HTH CENPB-type domain-containing protein n=1 Tax=Photinus pyralis TaxID=7054 RepID=A0A1Y1LLM0_PHOPY
MPKYTEKDLQEAVREVHQGTSQRSAAKRWHIPRATLQDRLNGGISHAEAHECRQRFSRQQEKLLSRWIFHLVALKVPPTQGQFEEFASRILVVHGDSQPLGKHWVQGFLRRNSEVKLVKGYLFSSHSSEPGDAVCDAPSHQSRRVQLQEPTCTSTHHLEGQLSTENNFREEAAATWDSYSYMDHDPEMLFDGEALEIPDWIEPPGPYLEEYTFPLQD